MDLANVLTVTSKRLQATVLGRKFTGRPQSVEERKKVTACTACGAVGHWMGDPECPKSSKGKGPHKSFKGKSDGKGSSGLSSSNPMNSFVVSFPDSQNDHQEDFDTHEPYYTYMVGFPQMVKRSEDIHTTKQFSCHLAECLDLAGYIIIDTACQRTCCGVKWLNLHDQLLRSRNLSSKTISVNDHFQFGAGGVQLANQRAYIPIGLQGTKQQGLLFGVGVLELSLPLLASNTLLDMLGSVINLVDMKLHAKKLGVDIPSLKKHNHLVCNILDFPSGVHLDSCWEKLERPSFWKPPHPEIIVAPGVILDQKSTVQVSIRSTSADALNITSSTGSRSDQGRGCRWQRSTVASRDRIETSDPPTAVHTPDISSVRKPSWPLRPVQSMRSEVPVERKANKVGKHFNQGRSNRMPCGCHLWKPWFVHRHWLELIRRAEQGVHEWLLH